MISDNDVIARCIIYPGAFKGGVHVDEALVPFSSRDADGASHVSGVLRRLAPADQDVHRIGCKISAAQNVRGNLPSDRRRYYCGFRDALRSDIVFEHPDVTLRIELDNEGDEPAHVDIALTVNVDNKSARNTLKAAVALALAEIFGSATPHICADDIFDQNHPLSKNPGCLG